MEVESVFHSGKTFHQMALVPTEGSMELAKLIDKYDENDELGSQELIIDYGNGIKEGIELIDFYEEDDKKDGDYKKGLYDIVDKNRKSVFS